MGTAEWLAMGTADWEEMGTSNWGAAGTAGWEATAWQLILQQELQTVHLTVELLLTARVLAVCDCLLTERSPRMC